MTPTDMRDTAVFREVTDFYADLFAPGTGHVHASGEIAALGSGEVAFIGQCFETTLEAGPTTAVYRWTEAGALRSIEGSRSARALAADAQGKLLAWAGSADTVAAITTVQLADGALRSVRADGVVESLRFSPDGTRLLALIAGHGADLAGIHGGYAMRRTAADTPDWLPEVIVPADEAVWRSAWIVDLASGNLRRASPAGVNVWEACWAGDDLFVLASDDPGEGAWYRATLRLIPADGDACKTVAAPAEQAGFPTSSPDGSRLAWIEAFCSDRGLVCGTLYECDRRSGAIRRADTGAVECCSVEWSPDGWIVAGQDGVATVVGCIGAAGFAQWWRSEDLSCGEWQPRATASADGALIVAEGWREPPRLMRVDATGEKLLHEFAAPTARAAMADAGAMTIERWTAQDGTEVDGLLVASEAASDAAPLVIDIHGGPVWANRPRWMARGRATPLLIRRGYRVLYPNPRGSAGRGQPFARAVGGDMGGADALDLLAGVDALVARGLADPSRLACTGSSYGGFMSCRLVTLDRRFAAAAPISPVVDWLAQHWTSQIPFFDELFIGASPAADPLRYLERSPVMQADAVQTPTLLMAGARDKNTPPSQALSFHAALVAHGAQTALVTYPLEGHSVRGYPGYFDSAARIVDWFDRFVLRRDDLSI